MGKDEFRALLNELGWRERDLAGKASVSRKQVSVWATGKVRVPGPVAAYLRLAVAVAGLKARIGELDV